MKRFIEDDYETDFTTPIRFVKSFIVMVLTAPYKLIMTISAKIIYLPKKAIVGVLLNSTLIGIVITILNIVVQLYLGRFSLFGGKFPIIVMIIADVLLAALYIIIGLGDFTVSAQLEELFGSSKSDESQNAPESEEVFDEEQSQEQPQSFMSGQDMGTVAQEQNKEQVTQKQALNVKVHEFDFQQDSDKPFNQASEINQTEVVQQRAAQPEANQTEAIQTKRATPSPLENIPPDLEIDESSSRVHLSENELEVLKSRMKNEKALSAAGTNVGQQLLGEQREKFLSALEASTDPSEFLSEALLVKFNEDTEIADDSNLEAFNIGLIPNNFKALV